MVDIQLDKSVVLITGGGTGLGLSMAKALYSCNANIASISLEYEERYPEGCFAFKGNVFNTSFVEKCIHKILQKYKKIDILINNIGYGYNDFCENMEFEEYNKMLHLNLISHRLMINKIKECNSKLKRVINISSTFSKAAIPTLTGYASTKKAILEYTRELALIDDSVSYACICPGYFIHKKHKEYFSRQAGKKFLATRIPMSRLGYAPKELTPAILMLCLPATFNIKYVELVIDGGLSSYNGKEQ